MIFNSKKLLLLALLLLTGCGSPEVNRTPTDDGSDSLALDQMSIAFVGERGRAAIKERIDRAMRLYRLAITEENYSRAGSTLVALRREFGPTETEILDYMIRSHVEGIEFSFPEMAGISAAMLVSGDQ